MLIYTLYRVYVEFMMPFAAAKGPNYEGLRSVRMYQLIANLLFIYSFLPGIYGAWKNKNFRMLFPDLVIFQLISINFIWLR
jgi:hypothetical protein